MSDSGAGTPGFKFNKVNPDDAVTTERIKPQMDAATRQRRATIIAVVVLAFLAMLYVSWERGGRENPFKAPKNAGSFAPGEHDPDAAAAQDQRPADGR